MNKDSKIVVFGARGLVGSALIRVLKDDGYSNIIGSTRDSLDLVNQSRVLEFFEQEKPDYVFMAAAKVGGIHANNTYRGDFIHQNLLIQNNIFEGAHRFPPRRLLFLGSSCIYPKSCPQPMKEEYLLTGELEQTNEPYAIAKIAGLKTAQALRTQYGHEFISVMPTNLYGPNDNFHPENSHVIPGLISRMTKAKKNKEKVFKAWGTGKPKREFLYVDDMARACIFIMNYAGNNLPDWLNIGTGEDISIHDLVYLIKEIVGFEGEIVFDKTKPNGVSKKLLNIDKIKKLGWSHTTSISDGIKIVYKSYIDHIN